MALPSTASELTAVDRVVLGIGGLAVHRGAGGCIVTHALGSCVGITIWDPVARVGGLLHAQLPAAAGNPERAQREPGIFVDLAVPELFRNAYALGAEKGRLRVAVAGGAAIGGTGNDLFSIGKRNLTVVRKLFWQNSILVSGEDTGGDRPRTMSIDFATGHTLIASQGQHYTI